MFEELKGRIYRVSNGTLDYMLVRAKTKQGARNAAAKMLINATVATQDDLLVAGRKGLRVLDAETQEFERIQEETKFKATNNITMAEAAPGGRE